MATPVYNTEDLIDSRDVVAYVDELESDIECKNEDIETTEVDIDDLDSDDDRDEIETLENDIEGYKEELTDLEEELKPVKELCDAGESYGSDWNSGAMLIRDSHFTEYAQQFVKDCGDIPDEVPSYIENNIDWDGVADDLLVDYTTIEFDGESYYIR